MTSCVQEPERQIHLGDLALSPQPSRTRCFYHYSSGTLPRFRCGVMSCVLFTTKDLVRKKHPCQVKYPIGLEPEISRKLGKIPETSLPPFCWMLHTGPTCQGTIRARILCPPLTLPTSPSLVEVSVPPAPSQLLSGLPRPPPQLSFALRLALPTRGSSLLDFPHGTHPHVPPPPDPLLCSVHGTIPVVAFLGAIQKAYPVLPRTFSGHPESMPVLPRTFSNLDMLRWLLFSHSSLRIPNFSTACNVIFSTLVSALAASIFF